VSLQAVMDYAYLNAKIRGKKSRFLSAGDYDRIYKSASPEELARVISGTDVATEELNHLLTGGREAVPDEIDRTLQKDFRFRYAMLVRQLPRYAQAFLKVYEKKFFVESLKIILKGKHLGVSTEEIKRLIVVPTEKYEKLIDQLVEMGSITQIVEQIPFADYKKGLQEAMSDYEQTKSPLILELALYKVFYSRVWSASYTLRLNDKRGVFSLLGSDVDLTNILAIARGKKQDIDSDTIRKWLIPKKYRITQQTIDALIQAGQLNQMGQILSSTQSLKDLALQTRDLFEKQDVSVDQFEMKIKEFLVQKAMRVLGGSPFQLGIFFSYLYLAQTEFSNIRAVIIGNLAGFDPEIIRKELIFF
jgi:V/A-type H+-transporting ATPase subunit C